MAWRGLALAAAWIWASAGVSAETLVSAAYATPVERYGHFALGRPHEYADLVAVTSKGRRLTFTLPADQVFEDLAPRPVTLTAGAPVEWLSIVSQRESGARLVLIGLAGDRLAITAASPPIGTPNRWLNPVGVADLDGDGRAEITAVITPHIGGTLKVYRRDGGRLVEIAALAGFSNHVYGSPELALSLPLSLQGRAHLIVPDTTRMTLRAVALVDGRLRERASWPLPAAIVGPLREDAKLGLNATLRSGQVHRVPVDSLR